MEQQDIQQLKTPTRLAAHTTTDKNASLPAPEKKRLIAREDTRPAREAPATILPIAFGLLLTIRNSPTKVNAIELTITVPIPSKG